MNEIDTLKNTLINDLWFPLTEKGCRTFLPRLRSNKNMKILTLTNDRNYEEIQKFIDGLITKRELITAWTYSHQKKLRLETYTGCNTEGTSRFEESIINPDCSLRNNFLFDILNLDFSSQDPYFENGRTENELKSIEYSIQLQKNVHQNKFIMIYTTLLNSNPLNKNLIINYTNEIRVQGWQELQLPSFQDSITNQNDKINLIKEVLGQTLAKYNYSILENDNKQYSLSDPQKIIFSIIEIIRSR